MCASPKPIDCVSGCRTGKRWKTEFVQSRTDAYLERQLLQALQRYSDWVCAQRLAAVFQGEGPEAAAALDRACTMRQAWFPELSTARYVTR